MRSQSHSALKHKFGKFMLSDNHLIIQFVIIDGWVRRFFKKKLIIKPDWKQIVWSYFIDVLPYRWYSFLIIILFLGAGQCGDDELFTA